MKHFPFKHHRGEFLALGDIHQLTFAYDKYWPVMNNLNGRITFHDQSMEVDHGTADMPLVHLSKIHAFIPYLKQGDVDIHAQMKGDLKGVTQFFVSSPLSLASLFKDLKGTGPFSGNIHLNLPVRDLAKEVKVDGQASMQNASWNAPSWGTHLTNANGTIHFTQNTVQSDGITGNIFGSPVTMTMESKSEEGVKDPVIQLHMLGTFSFPNILKIYAPQILPFVKGSAALKGNIKIYEPVAKKDNVLKINSDLEGVTISQLPDGLSKSAKEKEHYHFQMNISPTGAVIHSNYGHKLHNTMVMSFKNNNAVITSQHITIGNAKIPADQNKGLAIALKEKHSDLNVWYQLYENYVVHNTTRVQNPLVLYYLSAEVNHGVLMNQNLSDIHAEMEKADDEWVWRVSSSRVSGEGNLPITNTKKPWEINLRYAHLKGVKVPKSKSSAIPLTYDDIPPMRLYIQDFSYEKYYLHHLKVNVSHPDKHTMDIDELNLGDNALQAKIDMRGTHLLQSNPTWHVRGQILGDNFGAGLKELHLPVHLSRTNGAISIDAYVHHKWPLDKWGKIRDTMDASVNWSLVNGSFINLSPSLQKTLATLKILNAFSIQALPEKLAGKNRGGNLYFTQITGDGTLHKLHWRVPHVTLKSSELYASGYGSGNLKQKNIDFWVRVQPHLTGSVPVIATLAGGPVVGLASWVINKLIVDPAVSNVAAKLFHISGQWPKIKVKTVNGSKK